ncbi:hypothetical protein [Mucilaginibacter sp. UYCu711]|uniref:hypothetical protein n=1 Tax=Mucilaginibacter sp. UYCu711 TaxID=3156339 RepID=UPI003D1C71B5
MSAEINIVCFADRPLVILLGIIEKVFAGHVAGKIIVWYTLGKGQVSRLDVQAPARPASTFWLSFNP